MRSTPLPPGRGARQPSFDTLCAELLAAHPELCCIEIDHPATQRVKRAAVGASGQGVHFIGVDLAQQALAGVLA
ncbi:class I SAM-dependent methyltransferase [Massilia sp. B-10]|nr:class I SAM-dependent methyltransferase [Massilia sp. B-10]